ncbi:NAD-dependent epimerase/dehydratase family protein [Aggregatimonas sangjinii]|uniref:NAD-dependent epimerase/dehydratase family protein n=1 Tax=Aggregatimonas sangjinii TaxID=2583587 RepID=A0A5B7SJH2_9FLAO|nr:NAD-dependent epimerase/dehydratase family protein [Aggregatimonas sangjinii]QCW98594.1 NAD-dependent epimerase/dehydratase family protein [Aggregatimonas sangjinii]
MILVTGGTGLVGSHLLLILLQKGYKVRAVHRKSSNLQAVQKVFSYYVENSAQMFAEIEWMLADINDIPALETAFEDIEKVYHAAALISFDPNDFDKLMKVNVEGTANIVNLCIARKVQKLCYVSSIAAIGPSLDGQPITEENEFTEQHADVYSRSKYGAELEVWRGSQEGLSVVMINPGVIIGPGFWEGGSGTLFATANKGYSFYPPSGTGFVIVTDVARMMRVAMESKLEKERFIAVAENCSYKEILVHFTTYLGVKPPTKQLQLWQLQLLRLLDIFWNTVTGKGRRITRNGIASLKQRKYYSSRKAEDELNFTFEPIKETIAFSCRIFKEENR